MSFINNPLGAGGYSPLNLGDLTEQVNALQRTEIQRELRDIEQNKQWERDDRLRNQKLALEFADTGTFDGVRQQQIESFLERKKEYDQKAANFFSRQLPSTSPDYTKGLVELQREKQNLLNETMKERSFAEALQQMQKQMPAQRKALETDEQRSQFDKQIADFTLKLKDPKQKVEIYDMIQAFSVPEAPINHELNKTAKALLPMVKGAIKKGSEAGTAVVDRDALENAVRANMKGDDYLFNRGVKEGIWRNEDEMYSQIADQLEPSIRPDVTGYKPSSGGSGGSGGSGVLMNYTPQPEVIGGKEYSLVKIPTDVTQADRNFLITGAVNLDTKKTENLTHNDASIVGVDVENNKLLLQGKGGLASINGKPIYKVVGTNPSKSGTSGNWMGETQENLGKEQKQKDILKRSYTGERSVVDVLNPTLTEEDGILVVRGTGVLNKKDKSGAKEVPLEMRYETFTDPKSTAIFEADLIKNKPAVAAMARKVSINGIPLRDYFDKPQQQKSTPKTLNKGSLDNL